MNTKERRNIRRVGLRRCIGRLRSIRTKLAILNDLPREWRQIERRRQQIRLLMQAENDHLDWIDRLVKEMPALVRNEQRYMLLIRIWRQCVDASYEDVEAAYNGLFARKEGDDIS